MAIRPITNEQGEVIDEYDDGQPSAPAPESHAAYQQEQPPGSAPVDSRQVPAETAPDPTTLISQREPPASSVQQPASAGKAEKEDPTDFEHSDVKIEILLHRAGGDPQGRLVSVLIHNFSGPPATQDFREADLTDRARLDSIHRAIYPVMQRFLLDLAARKQKAAAATGGGERGRQEARDRQTRQVSIHSPILVKENHVWRKSRRRIRNFLSRCLGCAGR